MSRPMLLLGAVISMAAALLLPATASAKPVSSANLKALSNSINRAKHLTYMATYTTVIGGRHSTVTIAQQPPKSTFSSSGGGQVVNTGKRTYYCSTSAADGSSTSGTSGNTGNTGNSGSSGSPTCISVKGSNPLLGLEDALSPALALSAFAQARQGIVSRLLGVKVSSSTATFAGQKATCVTVSVRGHAAKYCVTKQGILAYSGTSSNYFELTQYSSSPPASLFTLPAGATTPPAP